MTRLQAMMIIEGKKLPKNVYLKTYFSQCISQNVSFKMFCLLITLIKCLSESSKVIQKCLGGREGVSQ